MEKKCPICQKETQGAHKPFCSQRCREVDLGRWLKGTYVMQTNEAPEEETPRPADSEAAE